MDDAKDKFGLPRRGTFFDEDFDERMAATEAFVKDAVEAVLRQVVDRKTAERMFREELDRQTGKPRQGRPPDRDENDYLLAEVERQKARDMSKTKAVRAVAEMAATPKQKAAGRVGTIERQTWRLIAKHKEAAKLAEEAAKRAEEARRAWAALITLRTAAGDISRCADYESALAEYSKKLMPTFFDEIGIESKPTDT
jgi:hypothetical protein